MAETRGDGRGIHLWHPLATQLICIIAAAGGPPDGAAGARPHCAFHLCQNNCNRRKGPSGWRHWRVSPLRHKLGHCTGGPTDGAACARPPVPLPVSSTRHG